MTSSSRTVEVPYRDLWLMVICTVRYAMGRASYVVGDACDMVRSYRPHLDPSQVQQIAREVASELRLRELLGRTLGHDIDHRAWRRLVEELEAP